MSAHDLDPEPRGARISLLGCEIVLFDVGGARFDEFLQRKVWAACEAAAELDGVREAIPGMNNFSVSFDPGRRDPRAVARALRGSWGRGEPAAGRGRTFEAPTIYGGPAGDELAELAK